MSNSESFVDEVSEAVREDRMKALLKRYGWIAVLAVLAIVGFTAWNEFSSRQEIASAQARGEALFSALETEDAAERVAALEGVDGGPAWSAQQFLIADAAVEAGDNATALARFTAVSENDDVSAVYKSLAQFKAYLLKASDLSTDERRDALAPLLVPGQPMRVFALEQMALVELADENVEATLNTLTSIVQDAEATAGQKDRARSLFLATGGDIETLEFENSNLSTGIETNVVPTEVGQEDQP